jgi:KaiC/GvpD/RAD55 family RecA-like ATPase
LQRIPTCQNARQEEGAKNIENPRRFKIPILDSLLPEGIPVPYTLLIVADPETESDLISNAILCEHLEGRYAKGLWLSLENFVEELRRTRDRIWTGENRIEFIDCYSSQIGLKSEEHYNADPTNLPDLSVVACNAISDIGDESNLLVILDSLSALIHKVGVRRSTEFFRWLVAKTRSIDANMLTTVNRCGFSGATLATYIDIADAVLELAIEDGASSTSKLRLRKARGVKHVRTWLPYKADFSYSTLHCEIAENMLIYAE